MKRKAYVVLVNILLFWAVADAMPGIEPSHPRAASYIIPGIMFGLAMLVLPDLLGFFKFPKNFWGKLFIGSVLTFFVLVAFNTLLFGFLDFGAGRLGDVDLLIFTIPKIIALPNPLSVITVSSILLNICSIILFKLSKGD